MTFKEYLVRHHIRITGHNKPIKRKIMIEYGEYESVKPIPYVSEAEAQMCRVLSLYYREHINSVSATRESFLQELNTSFSLRGYKKLIKELDIDYDITEFRHGCVWAIERLSFKRLQSKIINACNKNKKYCDKKINKFEIKQHKGLKQSIQDYSGKELD